MSNEGDTLLTWGTFQDYTGSPVDGLIWMTVEDSSNNKSAVIIHDRDLYWSDSNNRPINFSNNPVTTPPSYGPWQTLFTLREHPSYTGQSSGTLVGWLDSSQQYYNLLDVWAEITTELGQSEDLSSIDGQNDMTGAYIGNHAIFDAYQFPTLAAGTSYYSSGASITAEMWVTVLTGILGCSSCDECDSNDDDRPLSAGRVCVSEVGKGCATLLETCDSGTWECQYTTIPGDGSDATECENMSTSGTPSKINTSWN